MTTDAAVVGTPHPGLGPSGTGTAGAGEWWPIPHATPSRRGSTPMANALPGAPGTPRNRRGGGLQVGGLGFAVMVTVLLVALLFAANQNSVIGWLLVAISAGWLIFAVVVFLQMRKGIQGAARRVDSMVANTARHQEAPVASGAQTAVAGDPMRDTKLDHSFKICQVQVRVVREQLAAGEVDRDMVDRALETIDITASNARDMIKGDAAEGGADARQGRNEGPVSGTVVG